jgi:hypothetical protein
MIAGMIGRKRRTQGRKVEKLPGVSRINAATLAGVDQNAGKQSEVSNKKPADPHGILK